MPPNSHLRFLVKIYLLYLFKCPSGILYLIDVNSLVKKLPDALFLRNIVILLTCPFLYLKSAYLVYLLFHQLHCNIMMSFLNMLSSNFLTCLSLLDVSYKGCPLSPGLINTLNKYCLRLKL